MSALGQKQTCTVQEGMSALPPRAFEIADIAGPDGGQSISALPCTSNVDLLRYGEVIAHINAEIPHSALYLSVTKQKLDGAQIPGVALRSICPVKLCRLLRSQSGVKRTSPSALHMSAFDPKRTLMAPSGHTVFLSRIPSLRAGA